MPHDELTHELELVEAALAANDVGHAAHHVAGALAIAPDDERVQRAFDSLAKHDGSLAHIADTAFVGAQLLRAFALEHGGRIDEALVLAAQAAEQLPHLRIERVIGRWMKRARSNGVVLTPEAAGQIGRLLASVTASTIGLHRLHAGEKALLSGYFDVADELLANGVDPALEAVCGGVLRRAGRYDAALAAVERGAREGLEFSATQKGLVLRTMGDAARAIPAFEVSQKASGKPDLFVAEIARCYLVMGDLERASSMLERFLAKEKPDPELVAMREAASAGSVEDPIGVLDRIRRDAPFPRLEPPRDATMNVFIQNADQLGDDPVVKMAVSGWEPPSNRLLVAAYAGRADDLSAASYSMNVPKLSFDPLSQRRGAALAQWTERNGIVDRGVPAPSLELRQAIVDVARAPHFDALWDRATEVGRDIGWNATAVVAAMVHPPSDAAFRATLPTGIYSYQVAAACVLAAAPKAWTTHRDVFESILFGPVDWVSAAVVVALGELARRDAESAHEIRAFLTEVVDDLVPHSCEPRFSPLMGVFSSLPTVPQQTREKLSTWYRENLAELSEPEQAPPKRAPTTPAKKEAASVPDVRASPPWKWVALIVVLIVWAYLASR